MPDNLPIPPSVYRLLELIDTCPHDFRSTNVPRDLCDALRIALYRKLVETDSVKYDGGPIMAVLKGSAEAAERVAAYRASLNPTYWLTPEGRYVLAIYRETKKDAGGGAKPKARRGRKPDTDPKADKRVADAWASGHYRTHEDCARELGITPEEVKAAKDRHRKRQPRKLRKRPPPRE